MAGGRGFGLTAVFMEAAHWDAENFMMAGGGKAIALGILLAILSAVANGSFAVLSKTPSMRRARVEPLIFNFWAWYVFRPASFDTISIDDFLYIS